MKRVVGRLLGQLLKMVRAASGAASAPVMAPAVAVTMGGPSPCINLTQEALIQWVDGVSSGGYGG
jgi:hypothetical protein